MAHVCEKHGIKLLTYGTLVRLPYAQFPDLELVAPVSHEAYHLLPLLQCGGFLADEWLGKAEPEAYQSSMTPSQRKVRVPAWLIIVPKWHNLRLIRSFGSLICMAVLGYDHQSLGKLDPFSNASFHIACHRRPIRRSEHCKRGDSMGSGAPFCCSRSCRFVIVGYLLCN